MPDSPDSPGHPARPPGPLAGAACWHRSGSPVPGPHVQLLPRRTRQLPRGPARRRESPVRRAGRPADRAGQPLLPRPGHVADGRPWDHPVPGLRHRDTDQPAVHEVAREITPSARVAYVDNDPVVIAHNKAQLAAIETVRVVHGDIRQPEAVLADPAIRRLIDFSQPVGLLMVAVLHFITDDEDPGRIVAAFTGELAPGSYLALSHISSDGTSPEAIATIRDAYANAAAPAVFRTAAQIRAFFDGFAWEPPGLIDVVDWFPYSKVFTATPPTVQVLGGLGCKNLPRLPCLIPDLDSTATPEAVQDRAMTSLPGRWRAAFSRRILAGSSSGAPTAANSGPIPACPSRGAPSCTPPTRTPSRPESARPGSATSPSRSHPRDKRHPRTGPLSARPTS